MTKPCPDDLAAFKHEPADYEQPVGCDNPFAFPCVGFDATGDRHWQEGMDLRDWFAGQALAGSMVGNFSGASLSPQNAADLATEMYLVADAMLAARGETSHG